MLAYWLKRIHEQPIITRHIDVLPHSMASTCGVPHDIMHSVEAASNDASRDSEKVRLRAAMANTTHKNSARFTYGAPAEGIHDSNAGNSVPPDIAVVPAAGKSVILDSHAHIASVMLVKSIHREWINRVTDVAADMWVDEWMS